jgi:hypothetical protein
MWGQIYPVSDQMQLFFRRFREPIANTGSYYSSQRTEALIFWSLKFEPPYVDCYELKFSLGYAFH